MVKENEKDATGQAIAYLLLGVAGGLGLDLCAKGLLSDYSLEQFVLLRSIVGLSIFFLLARQFGGFRSLFTRRWPWHVLRMFLASGAMFGFFFGLSRMPLVDALTLGFTAPLMVTALSVPTLGEHVGWRRWTAVIDSWIDECHIHGFDSQAICTWNGPGPFRIENCFLEGGSVFELPGSREGRRSRPWHDQQARVGAGGPPW